MSRSYKKIPGFVDYSKTTYMNKRFASKKVRKIFDISDDGYYRKFYNSWNIKDWKILYYSMFRLLNSRFAKEGRIYKTIIK